ncbi:MAG: DUF3833 domain-containing protein [Rhodobacterales bacterium]|uniref:DUF3833 domain-containing protein n=1 Tax=Puniceibacterium antarcticum TaxID=1206336 RepID=UPI001FE34C29|nr:DUF3833 domain-containing protein [Puniceibacterium antarcticum]
MEALAFFLCGVVFALFLGWQKHRYFSFSAQKPADYAQESREFDLRRHLNGPLLCEGVIYGPTGRVTSRFVGHFDARWDGDSGVMTERFEYDSGDTQNREWALELREDGTLHMTASDLVGAGTGQLCGSALQMHYRMKLPEDAGGHVLSVTDWMYLTPNGTIVNRSQFRKYGIKVAELVATLRRKEDM